MGSLPVLRGQLIVRDEHIPDLGRPSKIGFLVEHPEGPRLFDVVLLGTTGTWLTLTGFERVDLGGRWADYVQTWLVRPVGA